MLAGVLSLAFTVGPAIKRARTETPTTDALNGHSHTVNVSASDQLHPASTTYTSSTASAHTHMVSLTADQLSTIASGGSVTVSSTASTVTGSHRHDFTFQGKK